jgi:3-oxoacyl-[acyl-carrier protein] reductase
MIAKELADELGPRNIRVNGLLPARIGTDRLAQLDAGRGQAAVDAQRAQVPLGRDGTPDEFARVATFLMSPAASYVTGTMVPVDGGVLRGI